MIINSYGIILFAINRKNNIKNTNPPDEVIVK